MNQLWECAYCILYMYRDGGTVGICDRPWEKGPLAVKIFLELYISRESKIRDDANCSKIAYSVLELYTEICELRKMH